MQSELDLSDAIKAIKDVAVAPKLYENLVQNNLPKIVSELLSHENTDIVIETINLLKELADPTTFFEKSPILDFLKALSKRNVFNLVSDNLERLSENNEDSEGLFDALSIFESIMETDQRFFMETFIKSKLGKNRPEKHFVNFVILAMEPNSSPFS
ncbi:Beta-catenin-like protein 1 [Bonamia ostreae]